MQPLRRKKQIKVIDDPRTGKEWVLELNYENDTLSDHGSVDSKAKQKVFFPDCGCGAPAAGRCVVCGALSCAACHGRCQKCAAPICQRHSVYIDPAVMPDLRLPGAGGDVVVPLGAKARLCQRCAGAVARRRVWNRIGRMLLKPFVTEEPMHGP